MSVLVNQVAPSGARTEKSHGHSPRVVRWLTAQQFNIQDRMPEQTVHVPHPLYNPVAQGNWPHSLTYSLSHLLDADTDGSEFYKCHYECKIFLASNCSS